MPKRDTTVNFSLRALCLTWLAALILTGSSPLFYLCGQSTDSNSDQRSSLWVTASAEEALAARLKSLNRENSGGMGSAPISGSVNLWMLAGRSILTDGASGDRRFNPPNGIQTPRSNSRGLASVARQLSLAGAEKRLEFTQLALKPTGVS